MNTQSLFDEFFHWVDVAYVAFYKAEGPGGTPALMEAAYDAKDKRTSALCKLMSALNEQGIQTLSEGHRHYYRSHE